MCVEPAELYKCGGLLWCTWVTLKSACITLIYLSPTYMYVAVICESLAEVRVIKTNYISVKYSCLQNVWEGSSSKCLGVFSKDI